MLICNCRISGENNCRILSCQNERDFIPVKRTDAAEFETSDCSMLTSLVIWHCDSDNDYDGSVFFVWSL